MITSVLKTEHTSSISIPHLCPLIMCIRLSSSSNSCSCSSYGVGNSLA
jgi:hypothetical protein